MDLHLPPRCLERYLPLEILATGGFGMVVLATQRALDRPVVLKLLHAGSKPTEDQVARFLAEARICSRLRNPHIVEVYECDFENGCPWIAYEQVDGPTVEELLGGDLPGLDLVVELGIQVARALDEAHRHAVFHRDIKPANILRDGQGQFKVIDFGIARWESGSGIRTQTGIVFGTPEYMAPEYVRDGSYTARSDLYSLGIVLFRALTGRVPFTAASPADVLRMHVCQDAPPPSALRPGVPEALDRLIHRLLARDPGKRPAGAVEVAGRLEGLLEGGDPGSAMAGGTGAATGATGRDGAGRAVAAGMTRRPSPAGPATRPVPARSAGPMAATMETRAPPPPAPRTAPRKSRTLAAMVLGLGALGGLGGLGVSRDRFELVPRFDPAGRSVTFRVDDGSSADLGMRLLDERGSEETSVPVHQGQATFPDLEPGTLHVVELRHPDGEAPLANCEFRVPPLLRVDRWIIFPADRWVLVDFEVYGPAGVEVRVEPLDDSSPARSWTLPVEAGGHVHAELRELVPGTEYLLSVSHERDFGGLRGVRFRTLPVRMREEDRRIQDLVKRATASELFMSLPLLRRVDDPRILESLREFVRRRHDDPDLRDASPGVATFAARFRDAELARDLFPDPDRDLERLPRLERIRARSLLAQAGHPGVRGPIREWDQLAGEDRYRAVPFLEDEAMALSSVLDEALCAEIARRIERGMGHRISVHAMIRASRAASVRTFLRWGHEGVTLPSARIEGESRPPRQVTVAQALYGLSLTAGPDEHPIFAAGFQPERGAPADLASLLRVLSTLEPPPVIAGRLPGIKDPRTIVWTAVELGLEESLPLLRRLAGGESVPGLHTSPPGDPVQQLRSRSEAMLALGLLEDRDPSSRELLRRGLDDPEILIARSAAWALGALGDRESIRVMVERVLPRDPTGAVIWALGNLEDPLALPPLRATVRDLRARGRLPPADAFRLALAIRSLGRLAHPEDRDLLDSVAVDTDVAAFVRLQARRALGRDPETGGAESRILFPFLFYYPTAVRARPEEAVRFRIDGQAGDVGPGAGARPFGWSFWHAGAQLVPSIRRGLQVTVPDQDRPAMWLPPTLTDRPTRIALSILPLSHIDVSNFDPAVLRGGYEVLLQGPVRTDEP